MIFSGVNEALLLIALGVGYLVLYLAKREEKGLRFSGFIIGGVIISLAASYLILGNIYRQANIGHPRMQMRSHKEKMQQRSMMPPQMMPKAPAQKR